MEPGYGNEPWEIAFRQWRKLSDRGYGERCNTPDAMAKVDNRIRKAKAKYERLLKESKLTPPVK